MPLANGVTPGAKSKLNRLKGLAKTGSFTAADLTTRGNKVYEAGIFLTDAAGKIYITDGVKTLSQLEPIVDTSIAPLSAAERAALNTAFSTGTYVAAEGGVAVLGANGKLADSSLNLIDSTDGKILDSYLKFIGQDGKIDLSYIPNEVRGHIKYVATYADLDTVSEEDKKGLVFVADASGDSTVESGWAEYLFRNDAWTKVAEGESLDVDVSSFINYESVEATGAVMYDHPVILGGLTLAEIDALEASESQSSH